MPRASGTCGARFSARWPDPLVEEEGVVAQAARPAAKTRALAPKAFQLKPSPAPMFETVP